MSALSIDYHKPIWFDILIPHIKQKAMDYLAATT